jgi:hypothetical protein
MVASLSPAPGKPLPGEPDIHINNVNTYHSRLKEWTRRFLGVATRNQLSGWHRALEASAELLDPQAGYSQRWAKPTNSSPHKSVRVSFRESQIPSLGHLRESSLSGYFYPGEKNVNRKIHGATDEILRVHPL